MTEYENEPIPGLPGFLPPGEKMLWQGSPDWKVLARTAFHTRLVSVYFALLATWALIDGLMGGAFTAVSLLGFGFTALAGVASVGLLYLIAWGSAKTTIYTLTEKRIVMRIGIALPKCINLPLSSISAADLADRGEGFGDVSLTPSTQQRLGYLALWPHARAWQLAKPHPMLRALPKAGEVAEMIARGCQAASMSSSPTRVGARGSNDAETPGLASFAEAAAA